MKTANSLLLSVAAATLVCVTPHFCTAQSMSSETPSASSNATPVAQLADASETAQRMVPAEVKLTGAIDALKSQSGTAFQARLDGTVQLKNGTELPNGTTLLGQVTTDQIKSTGTSRLSLQFTQAKLKDGKTIPIEATIVGISGPVESEDGSANFDGPIRWNGKTLKYDYIGVMSHVDLHSTIGGANSGTLVASDKSDMRLRSGSRLSLALAEKTAD